MSKQEQVTKIQTAIEGIKYAMVTSQTKENHLHSVPMTTTEDGLAAKEIWFLGDKNSQLVANIQHNNQVNLAYASPDEKTYVSINGEAHLITSQSKLDELWSPLYAAFYEHGKEDNDIQLIKVIPNGAEYWHSGNGVVNAVKMVSAAVTDGATAENMGENFSIEF